MTKKIIYINLLIVVTTCLQVIWASPNALSAVDLSTSPIDYIEWLCLFPMLVVSFLLFIFKQFKVGNKYQIIVISVLMTVYWLFINRSEFTDRVAGWSTFSAGEVWYYVLLTMSLPLLTCLVVFSVLMHFIFKQSSKMATSICE